MGTTIGGRSDAQGQYTIRGVPTGAARLRVIRIGYTERVVPVTVAAGQTVTQNVALPRTPVTLNPVVTTATGEQRRVELGNAVANIETAKVVETAPVASIADVLNSRAPGVIVTTGTQTGSGSRIRIRGQGSLNLSNDPIYVIDGVRMSNNSGSMAFGTGGASPSRVGDLNPEEIENIEIVKGPSAATLYGTDAANGVIVITTKRGRSGPARWSAWAEGGILEDRNDYPTNYTIAGHLANDPDRKYRECTLSEISAGGCVLDSVRTLNVFETEELTPISRGYRNQFGLQVSGGTEQVRYFLSGEREQETGVMKLPVFERRRFNEENTPIEEWTDRPNALERLSFRANLNAAITPKLDVSVSTGYINLDQRYSLESNATAGLGSQVFGGKGYRENGTVSGTGTPLNGYRAWTPGYTWQEKTGQRVNRFIGSANANWRPLSWWQNNMTVGIDYTGRADENLLLRGQGPPVNSTYRDGFAGDSRTDITNVSVDLASAATWQPREWLNSKTTFGAQYVNYRFDQATAQGTDLPPGARTAGSAAVENSSESTVLSKTLGFFVEEQLGFRDRLFVTLALRTDQNSAFGTDFQNVFYPKASLSWIISDETFFPTIDWLDQFRLRAAYGSSGVQPGPNDALRTFGATTTNLANVEIAGVQYTAVGNAALKPEKTTEYETGFEARLFGSRATIDLTYYNKRTEDALISAIVPPSLGAAATVRQNLGAVRNQGWELLLSSQLVDRPSVGLDASINASTNANKLLSLGGTEPQIGVTTRVVEGYPLFGFWGRKISGWDDKNNDGILTYNADPTLNEVFVDDEASFIGYNQPRHVATFTSGLEVFNRRLRLQALFDYRGGHHWYNNTERIRCVSRQNCNGLMNPAASFEEQAMVVATLDHPSKTVAGFIQKGDFVRFREVAATYTLPERLLSRLGGVQALSFNLSARNIAVWTDYRGVDPEIDRSAGDSNDTPDEFQTLGPPSYLVFRVNVGF